jgi:hypothetical protein
MYTYIQRKSSYCLVLSPIIEREREKLRQRHNIWSPFLFFHPYKHNHGIRCALIFILFHAIIIMPTLRLWLDHCRHAMVRVLPWRHGSLFKLLLSIVLLLSMTILLTSVNNHRYRSSNKHNATFSPLFLQNLIITEMNMSKAVSYTTSTSGTPSNYLDPFVYSRIEFTHNHQQRSDVSRKWCQGQSKSIRPQDLEPFKCMNTKQFVDSEHLFCLDPFIRNSCLIMSVSMGTNQFDDTFTSQLHQWGNCRIFSFDPYQQPISMNMSNIMMTIKPNWTYYRLGLTASAAVDHHSNLMTIGKLAEFIHLDAISARIDILIINVDNANEWNLLDDNEFFLYLCRHVKQLIVKTKPIYSKRFQHYRIFTLKLNRCFALLRRRSRLYLLGRHDEFESEWSLTTFSLNLGLFCDEIDMSMYLLVYGHLYLVNTKL